LRRQIITRKRSLFAETWPVDKKAATQPEGWPGWPDNRKFAVVLTHDVETPGGQEKCRDLLTLEKELGFRSAFYFAPERYEVSSELRHFIESNGCEVGVHGLYHDGKLYESRKSFVARSVRINHYLKEWGAVGFRSPSMHHNLEWIHDLSIEYDASTFDTDPFEPQPDGVGTIYPFWVHGNSGRQGYVELPYTLPQDYTLFVLMRERSIKIWEQKLDWIARHGGLALLIVHPDYMNFSGEKTGIQDYPAQYYSEFLEYITSRYEGEYWHVLPKDMARFWARLSSTVRSQVPSGDSP